MTKELWINLPVKDAAKSRDFFIQIGFKLNNHYPNSATSASLFIGSKNIVLMLFEEATFEGFSQNKPTNTALSNEVLFSFDAESREEVDEMARKVAAAGGNVFAPPGENQGWMYGFAFADLDGHRWNMLYMDMSKMPR